MTDVLVRELPAERVDEFIRLIRLSIPSPLLEFTIYGGEGIANYVAIQAKYPFADTRYLIAESAGDPIAAAEFRLLDDGLFLNYIAVEPRQRGKGTGTWFLKECVNRLRRPEHAWLELDVFEENHAARAWYSSLGFSEQRATEWRLLEGTRAVAEPLRVGLLAQAAACVEAYGFGMVTLTGENRSVSLGWLGQRNFRVTDPGSFVDPRLRSTCWLLDSTRRLLGVLPAGAVEDGELVARSVRLRAAVARVVTA